MKVFGLCLILAVVLSVIFIINCDEGDSGDDGGDGKHCTDFDYPLWCPDAKVCCRRGYAHYCDGNCYQSDPGGCAKYDTCYEE